MSGLIASLGVTAVTSGMSFAQAHKQKLLMQAAQEKAAAAIEEAKNRLDVNYYAKLGIPKEAYALAREASLVQGAQAMQGAQEADTRGVAATAGRVQMAQNEQQNQIRAEQEQQMNELQRLTAAEDANLAQQKNIISLKEASGAQEALADAQTKRSAAITSGLEELSGLISDAGTEFMKEHPYGAKDWFKSLFKRPEVPTTTQQQMTAPPVIYKTINNPPPVTPPPPGDVPAIELNPNRNFYYLYNSFKPTNFNL